MDETQPVLHLEPLELWTPASQGKVNDDHLHVGIHVARYRHAALAHLQYMCLLSMYLLIEVGIHNMLG